MVYFLNRIAVGEWRAPTPAVVFDPATLTMMAIGSTVASAAATGAGTLISYSGQKKAASAERVAAINQYAADERSAALQREALAESAKADPKIAAANDIALGATRKAADAEVQTGEAARQAAEFRAKQLDEAAITERAGAQVDAFDVRHQKKLALSKLVARAAASGGSVSDAGVQVLASGIEQEGEFRALTKMFVGENNARGLEDSAVGERMTGEAAAKGAQARAAGMLATGDAEALKGSAELDRLQAQRRLAEAGIGDPNDALQRNLANAKATGTGATATLLTGVGSVADKFGSAAEKKLKYG